MSVLARGIGDLHETGAVLEMLLNVLVFLRFECAILRDKNLDFFLVGVAGPEKKIGERSRQRGRDDLLILAVSVDGKAFWLKRAIDREIGAWSLSKNDKHIEEKQAFFGVLTHEKLEI